MSLQDIIAKTLSVIDKTTVPPKVAEKKSVIDCDISEYTIKRFINREYKGYALSVTRERALPCVIDGFKPSQRKAMYIIPKVAGPKTKHKKVAALAGSVIAEGIYHHGDVALADTISLMAADWNNNVPLLDTSGIFGSRLTGVDGIASPRYTSARVHENWTKYFGDEDILSYGENEDKEPKYFMPVIPWVLVNGVSGVAVGYASEIMPYKISEIVANIKLYMAGKDMKPMLPYFRGYKGRIYQTIEGVYMEGVCTRENSNTVIVTELPIGVTAEAYKKLLINLEEKEVITNFYDRCKNGFHFEIKHKRGAFDQFEDEYKVLGLRTKLNENINCIGEDGMKILTFADARDVIKYFVDHRLNYVMPTRKEHQLSKLRVEASYLESILEFLHTVCVRNLIDMNKIKNRDDLIIKLLTIPRPGIITHEHAQKISTIPIFRLNKEYMDVVQSELDQNRERTQVIEGKTHTQMYMEDLKLIEEK